MTSIEYFLRNRPDYPVYPIGYSSSVMLCQWILPSRKISVTLTAQAMRQALLKLVYVHLFTMRPSPFEDQLTVIGIIWISEHPSLPKTYQNIT